MNINITKEQFIDMCMNDNITLKEIQEKTGLSRFLIKKQLKELGLEMKKKQGRPVRNSYYKIKEQK